MTLTFFKAAELEKLVNDVSIAATERAIKNQRKNNK